MSRLFGSRTDLHYIGQGSDKVYHVGIEEVAEGHYNVWFAYGRRGNRFSKVDKKNKNGPVAKWVAQEMANKIVGEKNRKGYCFESGVSGDTVFPFEIEEQPVAVAEEPAEVPDEEPTEQDMALQMVNAFFD